MHFNKKIQFVARGCKLAGEHVLFQNPLNAFWGHGVVGAYPSCCRAMGGGRPWTGHQSVQDHTTRDISQPMEHVFELWEETRGSGGKKHRVSNQGFLTAR